MSFVNEVNPLINSRYKREDEFLDFLTTFEPAIRKR
jgi:hypothetical protein